LNLASAGCGFSATPPHDADALRVADELLGEPPEQEQLFVARVR